MKNIFVAMSLIVSLTAQLPSPLIKSLPSVVFLISQVHSERINI